MPLTKLDSFLKKVADLADVPSMSSAELKSYFDSSPDEVRKALNAIIDVLKSTTTDSGAKNIGVNAITGLTASDVQTALEALKTLADTKTTNTGNHAGTWAGYSPSTFPLAVTRDQMSLMPYTVYNGQDGSRYPIGFTMMNVSGSEFGYPASYGSVATMKYSENRMTQFFFRAIGATEMYYRYWSATDGYGPWKEVGAARMLVDKVQAGNTSISLPATNTKSITVTFPEPFSKPPEVVATVKNSASPDKWPSPSVSSVTASSFVLTGYNTQTYTQSVSYSWIAMV